MAALQPGTALSYSSRGGRRDQGHRVSWAEKEHPIPPSPALPPTGLCPGPQFPQLQPGLMTTPHHRAVWRPLGKACERMPAPSWVRSRSVCAKSLQSYLTLCNPMDCSPPGSSVHGILQARTLEWVAMPSSRGSFPTQGSDPRLLCLLHWQTGSYH